MNAINGLPMPDAVTVLVSTELLAQLTDEWSPPVQIHVDKTPGIGSGYEMICRTHTCNPPTCPRCLGTGTTDALSPKPCPDCAPTRVMAVVHGGVDAEAYARIWNEGYAEARRQEDEASYPLCTTAAQWGECILAAGHETHSTEGPGMEPTTAHVDRWGQHWGVTGTN